MRLFVSGSMYDVNHIEKGTGVPLRAYDVAKPDSPRRSTTLLSILISPDVAKSQFCFGLIRLFLIR